jgi:Ohr subfamily peroxiredoxin
MTTSDTTVRTPEKIVYTARATASGGRQGHVKTDDGKLDLQLTAPKETGGPGTGTNPEQLFASGYSACFQGALGLVAKKQGIDTSDSLVTAEVGFGPEGESFGIAVEMKVAIPGLQLDKVQELADAAHQVCPYSKATRGNIPVTITAVEAA